MSIAKFCDLLQGDEGRVGCRNVGRKAYHPLIGADLKRLRDAKRWSAQQVIQRATAKGFPDVTPQSLRGLESGQTQYPDANVLRGVAAAFGLDYEPLAWRYITANYGITPAFELPDLEAPLDPTIERIAREVEQMPEALRREATGTLDRLLRALDIARQKGRIDESDHETPAATRTTKAPRKHR